MMTLIAPSFKSLSFIHCPLASEVFDLIPFHRPTQLEITGCTFETLDSLMDLFFKLSCVEKLLIDQVNGSSRHLDRYSNPEVVILPKLRNLDLSAGMVNEIIPLLAPPPTLRDLYLGVRGIDELFIMQEFMQDLAPELDSFSLCYWVGERKDVGMLPTKLRMSVICHFAELCLQAINLEALILQV